MGIQKPHRNPTQAGVTPQARDSNATSSSLVSEMLFVGIVGRPHGLKGAFFVSSRSEPFPAKYKTIFIGKSREEVRSAEVTSARMQGDRPVIQCSISNTREDAEKLTGQEIFVSSSTAHKVFEKDVLWSDLIGCTVESATGKTVGKITHLYDNGASGVIQITGANADTADLPMVSAIFDLDNLTKIRGEKILVCLLPDDAIDAYWSRELAKNDET